MNAARHPDWRRARRLAQAAALLLGTLGALGSPCLEAGDGGFDAAALEAYARAQGGVEAPRTYAYQGTVYDVPSGRILATVDGWQLARAFHGGPADPGAWYVVRRAFLLYRDPSGQSTLAHYPDVRTSASPAPLLSIVRYALRDGRVATSGISGVRGRTREVTLPEQLGVAREDAAWVFRRVLSPPDPQQKPIELTEIVVADAGTDAVPQVRFAMTKVADNWGFLPAGGRHLLHLTWRPAASGAALAASVRTLLAEQAPAAMRTLPGTLDEAYAELGLARPGATGDAKR